MNNNDKAISKMERTQIWWCYASWGYTQGPATFQTGAIDGKFIKH
jgi:hypothetical protein